MAYTLHVRVVKGQLFADKSYNNRYCIVSDREWSRITPIGELEYDGGYSIWNHEFHFIEKDHKKGEINVYIGNRTKFSDKDLAKVTIDFSDLTLGKVIDEYYDMKPCIDAHKVSSGRIQLVIHMAPFEATPFVEATNVGDIERIESLEQENAELNDKVKKLEKKLEQLESENTKLSSRQSLLDSKVLLQKNKEQLQGDYESLLNTNEKIKSINEDLKTKCRRIKIDNEVRESVIKDLKNDLKLLEEKNSELTKSANEVNPKLTARIEELEENNEKLKTQNKRMQGKVDFLRDENNLLMNSLQSFVSVVAKAKGDFNFKEDE